MYSVSYLALVEVQVPVSAREKYTIRMRERRDLPLPPGSSAPILPRL